MAHVLDRSRPRRVLGCVSDTTTALFTACPEKGQKQNLQLTSQGTPKQAEDPYPPEYLLARQPVLKCYQSEV